MRPLYASTGNLLPADGTAILYPHFMIEEEAGELFRQLLADVPWQHDKVTIFGKTHITDREVAWFGEEGLMYKYSGHTRKPLPFSPALDMLRQRAAEVTGSMYNSCLINLYHSGKEGMGWHADNEKEIMKNSSIASISLGAERRFDLKHNQSGEKISVMLNTGSLLDMRDEVQRYWKHSLPKSVKITEPRINITFRHLLR
jgi:alkylated DNA repair dioxygenase AlkB